MTINEKQDEIIEEFTELDDWMDRYQLLIDLGNEQEPLNEKYKTESNLIDGCQSRVWLQCDEVDGKLIFQAESDALIVKGIIALLIKVLSGHTPDEILIGRALTEEQQLLVEELELKIKLAKIDFMKCGLSEEQALAQVDLVVKNAIREVYHPKK